VGVQNLPLSLSGGGQEEGRNDNPVAHEGKNSRTLLGDLA
jgi:hypothetical protein